MITRHHIALTLICCLIPCSSCKGADPLLLIGAMAGAVAGTILPDIHMKRPAKIRLLTLAWCLIQYGRRIAVPIICRLFRFFPGIRTNTGDKRLTHSIPGLALFAILCSGPAVIASIMVPGRTGEALMVFSGGILLGMIIHLLQDLCTRKGICPFYPFTDLVIHGSIRPCDVNDPRIPRFHVQHVTFFLGFQVALVLVRLPDSSILSGGFLCAALCIVSMIWQSDIQIERGAGVPSAIPDGVEG